MPAAINSQRIREIEQAHEEKIMDSSYWGGRVLEALNKSGKLRVAFHFADGGEVVSRLMHISVRGDSDLIDLDFAVSPTHFPERLQRFYSLIVRKEPLYKYTIFGPRINGDGVFYAFHLLATSAERALEYYKANYMPANFYEDPTMLAGHIIPITKMEIITDEAH